MKLLLIAPCEKLIEDLTQGQSMISIFHGLKIRIPRDQEIPSNAVSPKEWAIFSKWELSPEEEGQTFTSTMSVFWPDGSQFFTHELAAIQPTTNPMAFVHRVQGFPIGQNGDLRIVNSLTRDGEVLFGPVEVTVTIDVIRMELPEAPAA
jgi:hypothetical protein